MDKMFGAPVDLSFKSLSRLIGCVLHHGFSKCLYALMINLITEFNLPTQLSITEVK